MTHSFVIDSLMHTLQSDWLALSLSFGLALCYFVYLTVFGGGQTNSAIHQFNIRVREHWVDMILNTQNMEILAVQTLRNSVMAANFMASTSILLIIGTLGLADKVDGWKSTSMAAVVVNGLAINLWQVKLALLLLVFFMAFFCFSMSIRLFTHVGYLITLPRNQKDHEDLQKYSSAYLNKAGAYYAVGSRAFYFCLPAVFWFFGPYYLIATTVLLIGVLLILDRTPK